MGANTAKTAATVTCAPAIPSPRHLGCHESFVSHFLTFVSSCSLLSPGAMPFPLPHISPPGEVSPHGLPHHPGPYLELLLLALQRARCLHILWFLISVAHVLIISSDQSSYPFSFNFPVWLRASGFSQSCSPKVINASTPGQASSYSLLSSPLLLCLEEYKSASWNTLLLFRPIPMKTQKCDRDAACTCKF